MNDFVVERSSLFQINSNCSLRLNQYSFIANRPQKSDRLAQNVISCRQPTLSNISVCVVLICNCFFRVLLVSAVNSCPLFSLIVLLFIVSFSFVFVFFSYPECNKIFHFSKICRRKCLPENHFPLTTFEFLVQIAKCRSFVFALQNAVLLGAPHYK